MTQFKVPTNFHQLNCSGVSTDLWIEFKNGNAPSAPDPAIQSTGGKFVFLEHDLYMLSADGTQLFLNGSNVPLNASPFSQAMDFIMTDGIQLYFLSNSADNYVLYSYDPQQSNSSLSMLADNPGFVPVAAKADSLYVYAITAEGECWRFRLDAGNITWDDPVTITLNGAPTGNAKALCISPLQSGDQIFVSTDTVIGNLDPTSGELTPLLDLYSEWNGVIDMVCMTTMADGNQSNYLYFTTHSGGKVFCIFLDTAVYPDTPHVKLTGLSTRHNEQHSLLSLNKEGLLYFQDFEANTLNYANPGAYKLLVPAAADRVVLPNPTFQVQPESADPQRQIQFFADPDTYLSSVNLYYQENPSSAPYEISIEAVPGGALSISDTESGKDPGLALELEFSGNSVSLGGVVIVGEMEIWPSLFPIKQ